MRLRTAIRRIGRCLALAGVLVAGMSGQGASAQAPFPSRPLTLISPLEAGGSVDILARAIARPVSERLGANMLVENRPGANFVIAANACARARPDGYTLCLLPRDTVSLLPFEQTLPYDPQKDFAPVTLVAWFQSMLAASAALPVSTFRELVEYSKKNPGKLNYTGFGSNPLMMEWVKKQTGLDLTFVPFKGGPSAAQAFLAGDIHVMIQSIGSPGIMPMIKSGKMKPLMAPGSRRAALMPDVPTHTEVGLPDFSIRTWLGAFMPAGVPREVVARLNAEISSELRNPEFREKSLTPYGWEGGGDTPEEFARFLVNDRREGEEIIKVSGRR